MERWTGKAWPLIVTGASCGIGAAIALALANEGMKVVGIARGRDRIEVLSKQVKPGKGLIFPLKCDLNNMEDISAVFEIIKAEFGGVDVCINNAAVLHGVSLLDGTPSQWRQMMNVNVISLCYCSKLATQSMVERNLEEGHIINIGSVVAHFSKFFSVGNFYAGTKHAVKFITEGLRQEMIEKKHKIRVTLISPGITKSEMIDRSYTKDVRDSLNALPALSADDCKNAVLYALSSPNHVEVNDVILQVKM